MISPPNPRKLALHLPRYFFALIGALVILPPPTMGAENYSDTSKRHHAIPPGSTELSLAQTDYDSGSKELEENLQIFQTNASSCHQGSQLAAKLKGAAPAQKRQRDRISSSIELAMFEIQDEVVKLDGAGAEGSLAVGSGPDLFKNSRSVIEAGVAKPQGVINREISLIEEHNEQMEANLAGARLALEGSSPACVKARAAFFDKIRPHALVLPLRLKNVTAALETHKKSLGEWVDKVEKNLAGSSGRSLAGQ